MESVWRSGELMAIMQSFDRETNIRIIEAAGLSSSEVIDEGIDIYPAGKTVAIVARVRRTITQAEFGQALIGDTE